jgi:hypothetical protein
MKLFTQEQMIKAFNYGTHLMGFDCIEDMIDSLTPIELPSDEEIEKAYEFLGTWTAKEIMQRSTSFQHGAKWVINRIKQQDNGK